MKYQVIVESPEEAIVQTSYLNKNFNYIFLAITCDPDENSSKKKNSAKKFTFTSSALMAPYAQPGRISTVWATSGLGLPFFLLGATGLGIRNGFRL